MENDLEPDAKIIFQWKNPAEKRQRIINNEAEEYAVEDNKDANSGIIIYGRYGPAWQANPWSARALVKQLIAQLKAADVEVERLRAMLNRIITIAPIAKTSYIISEAEQALKEKP